MTTSDTTTVLAKHTQGPDDETVITLTRRDPARECWTVTYISNEEKVEEVSYSLLYVAITAYRRRVEDALEDIFETFA